MLAPSCGLNAANVVHVETCLRNGLTVGRIHQSHRVACGRCSLNSKPCWEARSAPDVRKQALFLTFKLIVIDNDGSQHTLKQEIQISSVKWNLILGDC